MRTTLRLALVVSSLLSLSLGCSKARPGGSGSPGNDAGILAGTGECNSCHGSTLSNAPPFDLLGQIDPTNRGVGAHQSHVLSPTLSAPVSCESCHIVPKTKDEPGHMDGPWPANVVFSNLASAKGASPTRSAPNGTGRAKDDKGLLVTCSSVYCHGATLSGGQATSPIWNQPDPKWKKCDACHGFPPTTTEDGKPHPQSTKCGACHNQDFGADLTAPTRPELHINGQVEVGNAACNACHGSDRNWAPPTDAQGRTDTSLTSVGAHQSHLNPTLTASVFCNTCHVIPAQVNSAGHIDDGPPAEVVFSNVAVYGSAMPTWSHDTATCSATYCHGSTLLGGKGGGAATAPVWTRVDGSQKACDSCHGYPPPPESGHPAATSCSGCHDTVAADNKTIAKPAQHVDGVLQVKLAGCNTCHGSAANDAPPVDTSGKTDTSLISVGAHQTHLTTTHSKPLACSECHPIPTSVPHSNGTVEVVFDALSKAFSRSPTWSRSAASCASTWCHAPVQSDGSSAGGSNRSPVWTSVGTNQNACGTCHGLPPPAPHAQNANCSSCHDTVASDNVTIAKPSQHIDGVKQVVNLTCTSCHGDPAHNAAPPLDTHGQSATTAMTVGAHQAHLATTTSAQVACSECHTVPTSISHSNGSIDLAFGTLSKTGSLTPSFDAAAGTCASTWCHGPKSSAGASSGGKISAPVWTAVNGSQKACDSCHGNPPPAPHVQNAICSSCHTNVSSSDNKTMVNAALHINGMVEYKSLTCTTCHGGQSGNSAPPYDTSGQSATSGMTVGAHQAHLTAATSRVLGCPDCHVVSTAMLHENGTIDMAWGSVSTTGGLSPSFNATTGGCASTWCHAPVQANGTSAGGSNRAPIWTSVNTGQDACGTCHGLPPPAPHVQNPNCSSCHDTVASDNVTIAKPSQHIDGVKQALNLTCTSCHGGLSGNGAPPYDTSGQSATSRMTVGAHQTHLTTTTSAQVACTECHPVPTSTAHSNGTIDLVFGTLSKTGNLTPSFDATAGTCASTWCHAPIESGGQSAGGSVTAPTWTNLTGSEKACGACHGIPPPAPHPSATNNCGDCHPDASTGVTPVTLLTAQAALHINGKIDGGGESSGGAACSGCHGALWTNMSASTLPSGVVTRHTLGNVAGTNDSPTDTAAAWTGQLNGLPAANRTCVNMCHGDHTHDLPSASVTTHQNNVYVDASTQSSRAASTKTTATRAAKDFDSAQTNGGLCTSCHAQAIDASHPAVSKTLFGGSAHDYSTNTQGTWIYTLHDGSTFARNCTKCHASRDDGRPGDNTSPFGAVHFSGYPSLLAGSTNPNGNAGNDFLCFNCHGNGTSGTDLSGKNVAAAAALSKNHPSAADATHNSAAEATATWNSGAFSGTNRHASCLDCHDPHQAGKTLVSRTATATSARNQIGTASPLKGADGIQFGTVASGKSYPSLPTSACASGATLPNACFTTTAAANFGPNLVQATYEYEICFKCHSSFAFGNTTYPTAPSTNASGLQETDVAAEFSPTNKSGHPVVTGLSSYTGNSAPKALAAAQLLAPWNTNVGTQTMLCTDCHNTDAASPAVQGPHGSAVTFMLAGTNRAWPYTVAGANSGTLFRIGTSETGVGTANGLFCRNCHPSQSTSGSGTNNLHTMFNSKHGSSSSVGPCVACHIRVPHGGKVSRLMVTTNAPARYKVGTPNFASFGKASSASSYSTSNFKSSCGQHSGGTGGEAW